MARTGSVKQAEIGKSKKPAAKPAKKAAQAETKEKAGAPAGAGAPAPSGSRKTPGSGRKKGTPNKITGAVKAAVLEAFEAVGGAEYLVRLADEEPRVFATLLAKCIPQEVTGAGGKDLIPETVARPVLVVPTQAATPEAWAEAVKALDNPEKAAGGSGEDDNGGGA